METGSALQVSPDLARARSAESVVLATVLTRTLAALWAGRVTEWHVRVLLHETAHLDEGLRRRVEAEVLDYACGHTPPQLRTKVKHVVARLDPADAQERHARARSGRRVWAQPGLDGMATFGAELPVEDLAALMSAIEAAAAAQKSAAPDDGRTMDNRRADALAAMGWSALAHGHIGSHAAGDPATGRHAQPGSASAAHRGAQSGADTSRCCASSTATKSETQRSTEHDDTDARAGEYPDDRAQWEDSAQDQESGEESAQSFARGGPETGAGCCCGAISTEMSTAAGSVAAGGLRLQNSRGKPVAVNVTVPYSTLIGVDDYPGQLAGYGTITAEVARRIAADGSWRRILTDPVDGAPLDYGRTVYEPPPDLAAFIELRDHTCRMPGCTRPARAAQLDHTIAFVEGGSTAHTNLGALDHVCHLVKTFADWTVKQDPHRPGRFEWTSPLGYTHTVTPEPVGPIVEHRAEPEPEAGEPPEDDTPPF